MIETRGLGAGSYPDAPDDMMKCYKVELVTTNTVECIVYAKSEDDARELAMNAKWDDIEEEKRNVEEILNIEECVEFQG